MRSPAPLRLLRRLRRGGSLGACAASAAGAASLCICCASADTTPRTARRDLTPYTGRTTVLFDDVIEPAAVGYQGVEPGAIPQSDALLRERTQTGDAVLRARVVTITSTPQASGDGWRIGFRTLDMLAGRHPPANDFTLVVNPGAPAAGVVRTLEGRLIGTTFVVFVRQFSHASPSAEEQASTEPELHFHFGRDDKDELAAVRESSLLGDVR